MIDETTRLDAYVEGVLAGGRPGPRPVNGGDGIEAGTRRAADVIARTLVRFHPSFRFEEALATRLRAEAEAMRRGPAWAGAATAPAIVAFRGGPATEPATVAVHGRGLLVGGAIASGLSLAGAAFLAWRRGHRVAS